MHRDYHAFEKLVLPILIALVAIISMRNAPHFFWRQAIAAYAKTASKEEEQEILAMLSSESDAWIHHNDPFPSTASLPHIGMPAKSRVSAGTHYFESLTI